jgi:hypothetical protein
MRRSSPTICAVYDQSRGIVPDDDLEDCCSIMTPKPSLFVMDFMFTGNGSVPQNSPIGQGARRLRLAASEEADDRPLGGDRFLLTSPVLSDLLRG